MKSVAMAASASGHGKPTIRKGVNPPKPLKSLPDGTHVGSGSAGAILQSLTSDFVVSKPRPSGDFQVSSLTEETNVSMKAGLMDIKMHKY